MTETFNWAPSPNTQGAFVFRVLTAQYGDGYKQTVDDGINVESQSWPLSFTGKGAVILQMLAFLRRHRSSVSFYWTPPLGEQGLYKATNLSYSPLGADKYTLTVTFEQVFAP